MTDTDQPYTDTTEPGKVIVECPCCGEPMLLGKWWKQLFDEGLDVPPCPDCSTDDGDQWADDADPKITESEAETLAT